MKSIASITAELQQERIDKVKSLLSQSDIVWGRYGLDTVEKLAERIVKKLDENDEED